ncbi:hypothetical protein SALBM311S_00140 [Streptomyces alboniger]
MGRQGTAEVGEVGEGSEGAKMGEKSEGRGRPEGSPEGGDELMGGGEARVTADLGASNDPGGSQPLGVSADPSVNHEQVAGGSLPTLDMQLKAFEGRQAAVEGIGKDPVNAPMIRHWCEAMGDSNPAYIGPEAIAPPTMLQVWTMGGLSGHTGRTGEYDELLTLLDEAGCTSVVATDCEQEYGRARAPPAPSAHRRLGGRPRRRPGQEQTTSFYRDDLTGLPEMGDALPLIPGTSCVCSTPPCARTMPRTIGSCTGSPPANGPRTSIRTTSPRCAAATTTVESTNPPPETARVLPVESTPATSATRWASAVASRRESTSASIGGACTANCTRPGPISSTAPSTPPATTPSTSAGAFCSPSTPASKRWYPSTLSTRVVIREYPPTR